jgi:hypothetical protein
MSLDNSPQAQFHRKLKLIPHVTKRMQGYIMGAFRDCVPKDLDSSVKQMWEAKQKQVDTLVSLITANDEIRDLKLKNSILLGRLNNRCEKITVLEAALVQAQQARQQSRKASLAETLTSTSLGFLGSLGITWATLASITTVGTASLVATLGCTAWSIVRGYSVRRYFNRRSV